jgi:hypothetical protein
MGALLFLDDHFLQKYFQMLHEAGGLGMFLLFPHNHRLPATDQFQLTRKCNGLFADYGEG